MNKKVIQRNLPLTQKYKLVSTFYRSLEDGGHICENCGRFISNIAEVKGETDNKTRFIGLDCAETLTAVIVDSLLFEQYAFQAGKSARAAILKIIKKAKEKGQGLKIELKTFADGEGYYKESGSGVYYIEPEGEFCTEFRTWKQFPAHQWQSHVYPMIKDLATV